MTHLFVFAAPHLLVLVFASPGFQQFPIAIATPATTTAARTSFNATNSSTNSNNQESGLSAGAAGVGVVGSVVAGVGVVGSVEKTKSVDGGDAGGRGVGSGVGVGSGEDEIVTLMLTAHCTFLPPTVTRTVKVASALFGGSDINHSQSMRRSLANPGDYNRLSTHTHGQYTHSVNTPCDPWPIQVIIDCACCSYTHTQSHTVKLTPPLPPSPLLFSSPSIVGFDSAGAQGFSSGRILRVQIRGVGLQPSGNVT